MIGRPGSAAWTFLLKAQRSCQRFFYTCTRSVEVYGLEVFPRFRFHEGHESSQARKISSCWQGGRVTGYCLAAILWHLSRPPAGSKRWTHPKRSKIGFRQVAPVQFSRVIHALRPHGDLGAIIMAQSKKLRRTTCPRSWRTHNRPSWAPLAGTRRMH